MRWLIVFGFVLCAAYNTLAIRTECVNDAQRLANGTCQCRNPNSHGDGDFCCSSRSERRLCRIRGDPVLKSYWNANVYIQNPCTRQVTSLKNNIRENSCEVRVFTSGEFIEKGFVVTKKAMLEIKYGNDAPYNVEIVGDTFKVGSQGFINIKDNHGPHIYNEEREFLYISLVQKDSMMHIMVCGHFVWYRAVDGTDPILQTKVPGVCIEANEGDFGSTMNGNACSLKPDFGKGNFNSQSERLLSLSILDYANLTQAQNIDPPEIAPMCTNLGSYYQRCSPILKSRVIKTCGGMLLNTFARRCMSVYNTNIFEMFVRCVASMCLESFDDCRAMKADKGVKNCYPAAMSCLNWYG